MVKIVAWLTANIKRSELKNYQVRPKLTKNSTNHLNFNQLIYLIIFFFNQPRLIKHFFFWNSVRKWSLSRTSHVFVDGFCWREDHRASSRIYVHSMVCKRCSYTIVLFTLQHVSPNSFARVYGNQFSELTIFDQIDGISIFHRIKRGKAPKSILKPPRFISSANFLTKLANGSPPAVCCRLK